MLTASRGLEEALEASARSAPAAIAEPVTTLAAGCQRRTGTEAALRAFAADIDDPAADRIAAALIIATGRRGGGVREVLNALAVMLARDVAARREIEAERAQHRTTLRWIAVFVAGVHRLRGAEPVLLGSVRHGRRGVRARPRRRAVRGGPRLAAPPRRRCRPRAGSSTRTAGQGCVPISATGREARDERVGDRRRRPRRPRHLPGGPRADPGARPGWTRRSPGWTRAPAPGRADLGVALRALRGASPAELPWLPVRRPTWPCSGRTATPGSPAR